MVHFGGQSDLKLGKSHRTKLWVFKLRPNGRLLTDYIMKRTFKALFYQLGLNKLFEDLLWEALCGIFPCTRGMLMLQESCETKYSSNN